MRPLSRVLREEVIAQSVNSTLSANRHMDAVGRERLVPLEQPRGLQPQAWQPTRSPSFLAVLQGKRHRYPPHRSKHRQTRRHSDSSLDLLARSRAFQHGEKIGPQASRSATPELRAFREVRKKSQNTPADTGPIRRRHSERGSALIETHRAEANRPMTTQPKAMRKSAMTARLVPLQPLQRGQRKSVMTHDERKEWKADMLAAQEEAFESRMVNVWERVSLPYRVRVLHFSLLPLYLNCFCCLPLLLLILSPSLLPSPSSFPLLCLFAICRIMCGLLVCALTRCSTRCFTGHSDKYSIYPAYPQLPSCQVPTPQHTLALGSCNILVLILVLALALLSPCASDDCILFLYSFESQLSQTYIG